jgi:hypothetical protein
LSPAKKILLVSGLVFITIQLLRPVKNDSNHIQDSIISKIVSTPDSVMYVLKNTCFDCHSNNTIYPWYSNVQPIGWLIAQHIRKGREELNFSEFGSYSPRRQLSKLTGIANSISDGIMPLSSYKLMHKNSILSTYEKEQLIKWAQQARDSLSVKN